jgi:single-strand DNA-binding protein
LALPRKFKAEGKERECDFISCVAWRTNAEFISKYFAKGNMMGIVGTLQTRNYDDKNGVKHYLTECVVSEVHFGGNKNNDTSKPAQDNSQDEYSGFTPIDNDDDLPF